MAGKKRNLARSGGWAPDRRRTRVNGAVTAEVEKSVVQPEKAMQVSVLEVERSLNRVQKWVEIHDYRGYEPFDGLSSWARPLALGNEFAERLLMQIIRQSPVN